jgi:regulator of RNase E activity RraA
MNTRDQELTARLERCYTGALYDVLRDMGQAACVLPPAIRPLDPTRRLAGPIYTVSGRTQANITVHETILQWTGLLSQAPAGSVIVCQPNDQTLAHMGELSAETLQFRGVRGYIVDGGCRDTDSILHIGFPVFCRYSTPQDIAGRWIADRFGEPITIGEVAIYAGDYALGDRDGVVILPAEMAEEAIRRTEAVMQTENQVRKAILQGIDPREAYRQYGKF